MSTLTTLLRLDFQKLLQCSGKMYLIIFAISIAAVLYAPIQWIAFVYILCAYSIALTMIAFDEQYQSSYLYSSLPVSRKDIIFARFTFYFVALCAFNIIYLLLAIVSPAEVLLPLFILILSACFGIGLIYIGLIQALCFRFKYAVVRTFAIIGYAIFISIIVSIGNILEYSPSMVSLPSPTVLALIFIAVGLIIYGLFYLLGAKLYRRKDFTE